MKETKERVRMNESLGMSVYGNVKKREREREQERIIYSIYKINLRYIHLQDQDCWLALVHDIFLCNHNLPFPSTFSSHVLSIATIVRRNEAEHMTR